MIIGFDMTNNCCTIIWFMVDFIDTNNMTDFIKIRVNQKQSNLNKFVLFFENIDKAAINLTSIPKKDANIM